MKIVPLRDLEWVPVGQESLQAAAVLKKVLVQKADLLEGHLQMINWCTLRVGRAFHPHYHEDMEEIFILLKGKARIRVGEEEADLEKEDAVIIPPPLVHEMKNTGEEEVEYMAIGISQGKGGRTVLV